MERGYNGAKGASKLVLRASNEKVTMSASGLVVRFGFGMVIAVHFAAALGACNPSNDGGDGASNSSSTVSGMTVSSSSASAGGGASVGTASGSGGGGGGVGAGGAGGSVKACISQFALGGGHTCAVASDGALFCWGYNLLGQLGQGTHGLATQANSPIKVAALGAGVAQVAAYAQHTCARATDGTVWCWGQNENGEIGDGTQGTAAQKDSPTKAIGLAGAIDVHITYGHTCAGTSDGSLWCWGNNATGQLGIGSTVEQHVPVKVNLQGVGSTVAQFSLGRIHTCARMKDGSLWCWGSNIGGILGVGKDPSDVKYEALPDKLAGLGNSVAEVAAGDFHTCARTTDGALWCWGSDEYGQLGDDEPKSPKGYPVKVAALGNNVARVFAGGASTCARTTDGVMWCWGNNAYGELGDGTQVSKSVPTKAIALGTDVVELGINMGNACVLKKDGTFWCWGANKQGQLGDGTTVDKLQPVQIMPPCP